MLWFRPGWWQARQPWRSWRRPRAIGMVIVVGAMSMVTAVSTVNAAAPASGPSHLNEAGPAGHRPPIDPTGGHPPVSGDRALSDLEVLGTDVPGANVPGVGGRLATPAPADPRPASQGIVDRATSTARVRPAPTLSQVPGRARGKASGGVSGRVLGSASGRVPGEADAPAATRAPASAPAHTPKRSTGGGDTPARTEQHYSTESAGSGGHEEDAGSTDEGAAVSGGSAGSGGSGESYGRSRPLLSAASAPAESLSGPDEVTIGWTDRARYLVDQIEARFPVRDCNGEAEGGASGHVIGSDHYSGNAADCFAAAPGTIASGSARRVGDAVADWVVRNAEALKVRYVIWYARIYDLETSDPSWQPYCNVAQLSAAECANPTPGDVATNQHYDHVHISVSH